MAKWEVIAVCLVLSAIRWVWLKVTRRGKASAETDEASERAAPSKPSGVHIYQGAAGTFLVRDPGPKNPYVLDWEDVAKYPQDRLGAEAFLTKIATKAGGEWFPAEVDGVNESNNDGTSRQELLQELSSLDKLDLEAEPTASGREIVVRVESDEQQIGFLSDVLSNEIAQGWQQDICFECYVLDVTGTTQPDLRINIGIMRWQPKVEP